MITLSNLKGAFNKSAILTPHEKAVKKLLNKFGGFVRKTQRNSMKRGKPGQVSDPGKPPLRHARNPDFKNTIFYFVDVKSKNVVIGPVLIRGKSQTTPMPGALEYGGRSWLIRRGRAPRLVNIRPRPGATLAYQKTIKKQLPDLIAGGIMREA